MDEVHAPQAEPHIPELIIPFVLTPAAISTALDQACRSVPYPPRDMKPALLAGRLRQVYLPEWLVDFRVVADWQIEAGFNYEVVSHQDHYAGGGWQSRQVKEDRVRWEPRLGRLDRSYANIPGPAIDRDTGLVNYIGEFDPLQSRPFEIPALGPAYVRLPNRSHSDAWPDIAARSQTIASEEVRRAAKADRQRHFSWRPEFSGHAWTLLLQPVYSTFYTDDEGQRRPIWINGQTGRFSSLRRASMPRALRSSAIFLAVAVLIFIIGIILTAMSALAPPLLVAAILAWTAALVFAILAVIPIARVWIFNHSQR